MDETQLYVPFNSISVIVRQQKGKDDNEALKWNPFLQCEEFQQKWTFMVDSYLERISFLLRGGRDSMYVEQTALTGDF